VCDGWESKFTPRSRWPRCWSRRLGRSAHSESLAIQGKQSFVQERPARFCRQSEGNPGPAVSGKSIEALIEINRDAIGKAVRGFWRQMAQSSAWFVDALRLIVA
jgi:hypothetical protein